MDVTTNVRSILEGKNSDVWTVEPNATVYDAISLMAARNIGALPVVENGRLLGVISERDYTRKVILHGRVSRQTLVSDIMTTDLVTVEPEDSVGDCLELMTGHRVRHLPVLERGRLVGLVSIGDLVNWIIGAQAAAIDDLEKYFTGAYPA